MIRKQITLRTIDNGYIVQLVVAKPDGVTGVASEIAATTADEAVEAVKKQLELQVG